MTVQHEDTGEEHTLHPIEDPTDEYFALRERALHVSRKGNSCLATQLAALAVAKDLVYGLGKGTSTVSYGKVFFQGDFALLREHAPDGYAALHVGYNVDASIEDTFRTLVAPRREKRSTPFVSPLTERMQAFVSHAEDISDFRTSLQNGRVSTFDTGALKTRIRHSQLLPEIRAVYEQLLLESREKGFY
ncbi:hypothetical protein EXS74_02665 [Candidatus Woesearchaeota archaeon]|nr:hypothetical protein [Candidatus Woesearchaeota archaeon]